MVGLKWTEIILVLGVGFVFTLCVFLAGLAVGKGRGFKEGLREGERLRAGATVNPTAFSKS